jgi:hypothetical protein
MGENENVQTLVRPPDLELHDIVGLDLIIHIDNRLCLTQDMLLSIRNGAIQYAHSFFTPIEFCSFYDNAMWWNLAYTYSRLGFIPTDFQVYNQKLFLHYYPPAELLMSLSMSQSLSPPTTAEKTDEGT